MNFVFLLPRAWVQSLGGEVRYKLHSVDKKKVKKNILLKYLWKNIKI